MLSRTTCRAFVALIVGALTLAAAASAARTDTSSQQALDALNRIRSENGIPAGITLNSDWSAKCAAHDRYMQQNNVLTHPEDPSKPGYSNGGNWAGTHAVLSEGGGWGLDSTPWDTAPIHLAQMLAPELAEAGIANVGAYSCLTTWPGYERTGPSDVIYTYPGDGRTDVSASEQADELPFVPGQFVGIPAGATTGPYLYVLPDGPWTTDWFDQPRLTAATLTGPTGPVDVRTIDNTNSNIAGYLPPGSGMVIPAKSLRANTRYMATATLSGGGDTITKTWSFTTLALDNTVSIDVESARDGSVRLTVSSDAPDPVLSVATGDRKLAVPLRKSGGAYVADLTAVPPGTYRACASSGGGGGEYQAASACRKVAIPVVPLRYVTVSRLRVRGRVVSVAVTVRAPFIGRRAVADLRANVWCSNGWCAGPRLHRAFALRRTQTFSLILPRQHSEVFLQFTIPGGKIGAAPYNLTVVDRDRIVP